MRRLRTIIYRLGLTVSLWLMGCATPPAKTVADDASCSPNADAEYALKLRQTCGNTPVAECPESDGLGDVYEKQAEAECAN